MSDFRQFRVVAAGIVLAVILMCSGAYTALFVPFTRTVFRSTSPDGQIVLEIQNRHCLLWDERSDYTCILVDARTSEPLRGSSGKSGSGSCSDDHPQVVWMGNVVHVRFAGMGEPVGVWQDGEQVWFNPYGQFPPDRATWLAGASELEELDLTATPITDLELQQMVGLSGLKRLTLVDTNVTDAGLKAILKDAKKLEYLDLRGTRVTDAIVDDLVTLSQLKSVELDQGAFSTEAYKHLRREMPKVRVN